MRVTVRCRLVDGFEGLVAKRWNSVYEPIRSGAWINKRINRGQEFVIGGYTRGTKSFDALAFGLLRGRQADSCRTHTQRLHTSDTRQVVQEVQGTRDRPIAHSP